MKRPYTLEDIWKLKGSIPIYHSLASMAAERLWNLLHEEEYVHALSAVTGNRGFAAEQAGYEATCHQRFSADRLLGCGDRNRGCMDRLDHGQGRVDGG
ncbi:MAG: hypothetical protein ACHBNF_03335 [Chromatiales bacterium]